VFKGDLYFYSVDHDYRDKLDDVDATECPVYVVNGEYDYLTTPEDGKAVADGVGDGATAIELAEIGHFPMSEHPELFNGYIDAILADAIGELDEPLPDRMTPADVDIEMETVEAAASRR
jgi:pimeloyl-ACP methyl ester carboxylesterase